MVHGLTGGDVRSVHTWTNSLTEDRFNISQEITWQDGDTGVILVAENITSHFTTLKKYTLRPRKNIT